jgi:signal transduction histidine kinase
MHDTEVGIVKSRTSTSEKSSRLPDMRLSISTVFLGSMIIVAVLAIAVIGYFWISREYKEFTRESRELRAQFLDEQRAMIRNEVEKVIDYIEFSRSRTEERLKTTLKGRVGEAHSIALNIYETYKGSLPSSEIERIIKEALRPIRFNNGRGYYFAVTMKGVEMLYPVAPQFENQDLLNLQDGKGNYVIRDEIKVIEQNGEGFVRDYWRKPEAANEMIYPKMTYVRLFKPLNWYIGTGEYLDDFEHDLQDEIIERVANVRFGNEGYIFINTYKGDPIITNGVRVTQPCNLWDLTDPNGVKVMQEERRAVNNPEGDYIYYTWNKLTNKAPSPKVSFIRGIPDWQWMIGAGVYLDEVEKVIAAKRLRLQEDVRTEVARIVAILLSLVIAIVLLARFFTLRMRRSIVTFSTFFQGAATESVSIDVSKLHFSEFAVLARAANSMIDDRNRAEEEKKVLQERLSRSKKMEALGLLTGGVAHDLNNILSGFVSYPELLLMDLEPDSKLRRPLEVIHESGLRAAAVVADLLNASRGAQGISEVLNINASVEAYLRSPEQRNLAGRYPAVQVRCKLAQDLLNVRCSPAHLGKTLMNLVANAVEAIGSAGSVVISTENRSVKTPVHGYEEVPAGEYVVLKVEDDGAGISAYDLSRVFEPFFTKKVLGRSGTGLGLTVVWHAVHDHNGFIDVKSSTTGTVFELYFPVSHDDPEQEKEPAPIGELKGAGERILVVDDEPNQREIACDLLRSLGYQVEAVDSGEKALDWLAEQSADLIILDMILGAGMDGRRTYEEILKIRLRQKAIIASGFAETDDVKAALALGAGTMVRKPYTLYSIAVAVHQELRKKA